jgi:hypothetical protein
MPTSDIQNDNGWICFLVNYMRCDCPDRDSAWANEHETLKGNEDFAHQLKDAVEGMFVRPRAYGCMSKEIGIGHGLFRLTG